MKSDLNYYLPAFNSTLALEIYVHPERPTGLSMTFLTCVAGRVRT